MDSKLEILCMYTKVVDINNFGNVLFDFLSDYRIRRRGNQILKQLC